MFALLVLFGLSAVGAGVAIAMATDDGDGDGDTPGTRPTPPNPVMDLVRATPVVPPTPPGLPDLPPPASSGTGSGTSKPNPTDTRPNADRCRSLGFHDRRIQGEGDSEFWACERNDGEGMWIDPNAFTLGGDSANPYSLGTIDYLDDYTTGQQFLILLIAHVYRNNLLRLRKPREWSEEQVQLVFNVIQRNASKLIPNTSLPFAFNYSFPKGWEAQNLAMRRLYKPSPPSEGKSHDKSTSSEPGFYPVLFFPSE